MVIACLFGSAALAQALSGDEILLEVAERGVFSSEGSVVSRIGFDLVFKDGSTAGREFAFFGRSEPGDDELLLIYFLQPPLECGTIFLSRDSADPGAGTSLWLFLSGLGQVKELVSEADRNASFAGSNFENDQLGGGFDLHEDYVGTLTSEEALEVDWMGASQGRTAFRVTLEERPEADVDFPTGVVWVDRETFVVLKAEFDNASGVTEQVFTPADFVAFEDDIVPNVVVVANVLEGSETTVRTLERFRPENGFSEDVFAPENLKTFDPGAFGIASDCVF